MMKIKCSAVVGKYSFTKLSIIGVVITQLLLSGCAPQEKPPVEEPKADPVIIFDDLLRKDEDVVLIEGEEKTIKELKEEYGAFYHLFVDYSDEEIEALFENYIRIIAIANKYNFANFDSIIKKEKPLIGRFGNYEFYEDFKVLDLYGAISDDNIADFKEMLDTKNPIFYRVKKYTREVQNRVSFDSSTVFDSAFSEREKDATLLLNLPFEEKKENLLVYMIYHEYFLEAVKTTNFPLEMAKEIEFKAR